MSLYSDLFSQRQPVIGMVHLPPLPGSPAYTGALEAIYARAHEDAAALLECGIDALIVENFGDEPFRIGEPDARTLALMAAITREIARLSHVPVGVNVQFNAWEAEMSIAHVCGAHFCRVEVFVDTVVSAQGLVMPCSAGITRLRAALGARVAIFADIQTKYTSNLVAQPLAQSAKDAQAAGADALIVTGSATGSATPLEAVREAKGAVRLPVLVGSGATEAAIPALLQVADGAIVGSAIKQDGVVTQPVSRERTAAFLRAARGGR